MSTERSSSLLPLAVLAALIIGSAVGSVATGYFIRHERPGPAMHVAPSPVPPPPYVDHGSDVYEFPSVNEEFTRSVVAFLNEEKNAGLHCHLLADTYGFHAREGWKSVTGHLLQCHDASVYAQAETVP